MNTQKRPAAQARRSIPTPEAFERLARTYFADCEAAGRPVLFTGLLLALGLSGKKEFFEYAGDEAFAAVARRAILRVEQEYEAMLHGGGSVSGAIFGLKNMGWQDKPETDPSGPPGGPGANEPEGALPDAATGLTPAIAGAIAGLRRKS